MNAADLVPQGSNVWDAAIVLILAVMGYAQLRLRQHQTATTERANRAEHRANTAAVKAEATQAAMPPDQREAAQAHEEEIALALENNGAEAHKNFPGIGYYP